MDQLPVLLLHSSQGNNEEVAMATQQLQILYQSPELVFPLLDVMQPTMEPAIRGAAAIAFKPFLGNCWMILMGSEHAPAILERFLNVLTTETDLTIRRLFVDALQPVFTIFRETLDIWPAFFEFLNTIRASTDGAQLELFLYIFHAIMEYLPLELFYNFYEQVYGGIQAVFSAPTLDVNLAETTSRVCSAVLCFIETTPENTNVLYHALLLGFQRALAEGSALAQVFMKDLKRIIKHTDQFAPARGLAHELFNMAIEESVDISSRCLIAHLLCAIINRFHNEVTCDEAFVGEIVAISLHLTASSFGDVCFDEDTDIWFAISPIECLSKVINPEVFFSGFWSLVRLDSVNGIIAVCAAVVSFIEHIPEVIDENFGQVFEFAVNCINHENHSVKEGGISICYELCARNNKMLSNEWEKLLVLLNGLFQTNHEAIVRNSLTTLAELLYVTEIGDAHIPPVLELLGSCLQAFPPFHLLVLTCFAALCESAGESMIKYVGTVGPVVMQAAAIDVPDQAMLKARGVEALGSLIRYVPEQMGEAMAQAPGLFLTCAHCDDINLVASALMALRSMAMLPVFPIEPQPLFEAIVKVLQFDLQANNITKETGGYEGFMEAKELALRLIITLVKNHPEAVAPFVQVIVPLAIGHCEHHSAQVELAAVKCTILICKLAGSIPDPFIDNLTDHFEDEDKEIACLGFYAFSLIAKYQIPLNEHGASAMIGAIQTAFMAMNLEMACQSGGTATQDDEGECDADEELTIELKEEVFDFLATVAQYCPAIYPLDEVVQRINDYIKEEDTDMAIELIGTLVEYYAVANAEIHVVAKGTIQMLFLSGMQLCKFDVPPNSISGVRCVIEAIGKIEEVPAILQGLAGLITADFEGQPYYWITIASSISLLLSIFRVCGGDEEVKQFDVGSVMPKILANLPQCLCKEEADNILTSLVAFCTGVPQFAQTFVSELVRVFSQVLGYRASQMRKLKVSDETIAGMCRLWVQLTGGSAEAIGAVEGLIGDVALQRLQVRVAAFTQA